MFFGSVLVPRNLPNRKGNPNPNLKSLADLLDASVRGLAALETFEGLEVGGLGMGGGEDSAINRPINPPKTWSYLRISVCRPVSTYRTRPLLLLLLIRAE